MTDLSGVDYKGDEVVVYSNWALDGARNLTEAADLAHWFANYLQDRHDEGWKFRYPPDGGYGLIYQDK